MTRERTVRTILTLAVVMGVLCIYLHKAYGHCDTLDGPVIQAARIALAKGDVSPILKWVKKEHETEIRDVFARTLKVRSTGPEAKELADMYLFETLVRIHRAGEGAAYTGLKPPGTVEPPIAAADKALENGSVDGLVKAVTRQVEKGIRERFAKALEKKQHADESVEAGREFVEAYVQYVHYVEGIHQAVMTPTHGHSESSVNTKTHGDH
ncbi:MAG TPA: DUF6448 family protein [Sedimentisphaerales bacterium]|nr:DUF6448 family protein [Sedimentisphaerales bacterium]